MTQLSESKTWSVAAIGNSCVILSERSESKDLLQRSEVETRSVASVGTADSPRSE